MNKRLELYEIALANCESDKDINFVLEMASTDEFISDDDYTTIYYKADAKIRNW